MTSTPSVRADTETHQEPGGLLIATWGDETTGMRIYAQDDRTLQLWRRHSSIPRHLATVTPVGSGCEIEWTSLGLEHPQYWRDFWESKIRPTLIEHQRATA